MPPCSVIFNVEARCLCANGFLLWVAVARESGCISWPHVPTSTLQLVLLCLCCCVSPKCKRLKWDGDRQMGCSCLLFAAAVIDGMLTASLRSDFELKYNGHESQLQSLRITALLGRCMLVRARQILILLLQRCRRTLVVDGFHVRSRQSLPAPSMFLCGK